MRTRLTAHPARWLFACLAAVAFAFPAGAAELTTQNSAGVGVTVAVTPQNIAPDSRTWDFKVALNTHSQELNDDLVKSSVLLDGSGTRYTPTAWDGAAPGGHHRSGVLRFRPLPGKPRQLELQIQRAGEAAPRSFRWQLD